MTDTSSNIDVITTITGISNFDNPLPPPEINETPQLEISKDITSETEPEEEPIGDSPNERISNELPEDSESEILKGGAFDDAKDEMKTDKDSDDEEKELDNVITVEGDETIQLGGSILDMEYKINYLMPEDDQLINKSHVIKKVNEYF